LVTIHLSLVFDEPCTPWPSNLFLSSAGGGVPTGTEVEFLQPSA